MCGIGSLFPSFHCYIQPFCNCYTVPPIGVSKRAFQKDSERTVSFLCVSFGVIVQMSIFPFLAICNLKGGHAPAESQKRKQGILGNSRKR